jgi:hypothetical protein
MTQTRVESRRRPAAPPPTSRPARPRSGARPNRRPLVAGLLAFALLAAGGGVAAVLLSRNDSGGGTAPGAGADTDALAGTPTGGEGSGAQATTTTPVVTNHDIEAGDYITLGSFRGTTRAQAEADRITATGLKAEVYDSNITAQLQPAFFVILAGPFSTQAAQSHALVLARHAGIKGSRRRALQPAAAQTDPPDGLYEGKLTRVAGPGSPLNRTIDTTIQFDSGGESASLTFDEPSCSGDLQLAETHGAVRTYDETITSGSCLSGGTWSVKTSGTQVLVTWWHPDRTYFVIGSLAAG